MKIISVLLVLMISIGLLTPDVIYAQEVESCLQIEENVKVMEIKSEEGLVITIAALEGVDFEKLKFSVIQKENINKELKLADNEVIIVIDDNAIHEVIAPTGLDPVSIIIGIVVAYIVGGVIIYTTGQSGEEWVASAFEWLANWPHTMEIHYSVNNPYRVLFGIDFRSCIIYPCGTMLCPRRQSISRNQKKMGSTSF